MIYGQYVFNYMDLNGQIWWNNDGTLEKIKEGRQVPTDNLVKTNSWTKLGIQGPAGMHFTINDIDFIMGKSGIYEINNYEIKTFKITVPLTGKNIIIDYAY